MTILVSGEITNYVVHYSSDVIVNPLFCWKFLRAVIPKRKDETSLYGNGLKSLRIGKSAGKFRIGKPSSTIYVETSVSKWAVSHMR